MGDNPYSRQLEILRERLGHESVQEFVDALNEWLEKPFPYATARRYHRDRVPPVDYLTAVAHAFEIRLEWLATGEGGMTKEGEEARQLDEQRTRLRESLESGDVGDYTTAFVMPRSARLALQGDLSRNAVFAAWRAITGGGRGTEDRWRDLESALLDPLETLGLRATEGAAFDDYVHDMACAIRRYARAVMEETADG